MAHMKKTCKYLYGMDSLEGLVSMPYPIAIAYKIVLAKMTQEELVREHNMEDFHRMKAVDGAIKFNRGLLEELGMDDKAIRILIEKVLIGISKLPKEEAKDDKEN